MTYGFFYYGGIYNLLIYGPIAAGLTLIVPVWDFRLLSYVPGPVGFVIYWLLADAAGYWIHRWYHHNPILWEFHKVHHAQTELTFVTSFRNHAVEQIVSNTVLFVPLMVLGLPLWYWAPVVFVQFVFEGLQHSDLKWRYGWFYALLVSPVFHVRCANEFLHEIIAKEPRLTLKVATALKEATTAFHKVFGGDGTAVTKYTISEQGRLEAGFRPEEVAISNRLAEQRRDRAAT